MDALDSSLLLKLQKEFPLTPRPFQALGAELGISEEACIERVRALKREGVIRQMSAIFDSRSLSYKSALVAASIPAPLLEEGAAVVSAHPGVSHNYQRDHEYNLWFTLALAPDIDFVPAAARLAHAAHASRWLILPSLKTFKIEVALDSAGASEAGAAQARVEAPVQRRHEAVWLSDLDKQAVRVLQEDLGVEERPFLKAAASLGLDEEGLFDWMAEAGRTGILRRFAAILRHRKAGFSVNGMGIWIVPPGRVEDIGTLFSTFRAVSHCYERPTGPDWPYNLFTMVHAKSQEACDAIFAELGRASGAEDYRVLFSSREFKKERVKYFLEGRARHAAASPG